MESVTKYFLLGTLAENALSATFSASCHHFSEDSRIPSVIMPKRELRQVERQILLAILFCRKLRLELMKGHIRLGAKDFCFHNGEI
jgi:hypothetical protein